MINEALVSANTKERSFTKVFNDVQNYISENHPKLISGGIESSKEQLRKFIKKYLTDNRITARGMSLEETIEKIFCEMTEFSILTEFLDSNRDDIEEININAWNDIKVCFSDGTIKSSKEHFFSPEHAENIIKRLLNDESKMILDKSKPIVRGHLSNKIRITVMGEGVIDKSIGLACSMRIVNPRKLQKKDFIKSGTATEEMLTVLTTFIRNGISICVTGETNSGKTTLMSWLLSTVQSDKRIFTIEEDVREFNLIKHNEDDRVVNNIVHTITKKSDDPTQIIDSDKLLETALTMNPDVICVAEMKGKESFAAQEAARTGHTVITTTHAKSCRATYFRMVTLCKGTTSIDSKTLNELVRDAFPIVIYIKRLGDKTRRIMEITECVMNEDGTSTIETLYKFDVKENIEDNEGNIIKVVGDYVKVNNISDNMKNLLISNGMPSNTLDRIFESKNTA